MQADVLFMTSYCAVTLTYVCCQKAHEACGPLEIDSALKTVQTLKCELQDAKMSVIDGQLRPLPGETVSTQLCF